MAVNELAETVAKAYKTWGKALAARERAEVERSLSHYRARATIRSDCELRGEKITEARLEEQSRLGPEVTLATEMHLKAIEACEDAQAELLLAKMNYDIAMKS